MTTDELQEIRVRLARLEDEAEIRRLVLSYGPAADAGMASLAAGLWLEDGVYDWDADVDPYRDSSSVEAMLKGDQHQGLMAAGVAHFGGPLLIDLDGDKATVVNYSLVMRREEDRHYLWRVSAVRWDVERVGSQWRVRRRTNRLLDASGGGRNLFSHTLREIFGEEAK